MKRVFFKIMSFLMAFVVLFSTMSFSISMHYCGDHLVETVIFQKAKGCGMEKENISTNTCAVTKKNCCSNKQLLMEGQDELNFSFDKTSHNNKVFINLLSNTYTLIFKDFNTNKISYQTYKPPVVVKQIFKIDETYLI